MRWPDAPRSSSKIGGLLVAPSLRVLLGRSGSGRGRRSIDGRVTRVAAIAAGIALVAALIAQVLTRLIGFVTNVAFYGRASTASVSPADHHLGGWVLVVPAMGGVVVGFMARYGSKAIRGHGIPEAMEQVLTNESRVPWRMTFLKPLSAAIAIGTGGPFGAEGPIIATGGAFGSLVGQLLPTTAHERKALLAAGAAAGMTATFGSPVSALLLAIELLLFEYRPRSLIPVAIATVVAAAARVALVGTAPVFPMPELAAPSASALGVYLVLGGLVGVASVWITRLIYAIEDAFERLPIHWMFWPAIGGVAVGAVGYYAPRTLGVGYDNIEQILGGRIVGPALLALSVAKLVSWSLALGSGTSGGTLAPLFTVGGAFGAALGAIGAELFPHAGIDPRIGALVGMASIFAGASRAVLASVVFAFETTRQPLGLVPLLAGCTAAYLISMLMMENSIMTEKIARRGVRVPSDYGADLLDHVLVGECAARTAVTLDASQPMAEVRAWLTSGAPGTLHQGYPVMRGRDVVGVVTRRDLIDDAVSTGETAGERVRRAPVCAFENQTLRMALEAMLRAGVGRLPVLSADGAERLVGILTRSDVLAAYRRVFHESETAAPTRWRRRRNGPVSVRRAEAAAPRSVR